MRFLNGTSFHCLGQMANWIITCHNSRQRYQTIVKNRLQTLGYEKRLFAGQTANYVTRCPTLWAFVYVPNLFSNLPVDIHLWLVEKRKNHQFCESKSDGVARKGIQTKKSKLIILNHNSSKRRFQTFGQKGWWVLSAMFYVMHGYTLSRTDRYFEVFFQLSIYRASITGGIDFHLRLFMIHSIKHWASSEVCHYSQKLLIFCLY